jgi:hypothetical protein
MVGNEPNPARGTLARAVGDVVSRLIGGNQANPGDVAGVIEPLVARTGS